MDDRETKTAEPARSIPVMDVQPPKAAEPETFVAIAPEETTESSQVPITSNDTTQDAPFDGEVSEEPKTDELSDQAPTQPEAPLLGATSPMAITPANAGPAKGKASVAAIVAAILIALVLSGATIFAYLKTKDQAVVVPMKAVTPASQQTAVTATDVQQASTELDESLKAIDENKDFASSDLDDTTLGL